MAAVEDTDGTWYVRDASGELVECAMDGDTARRMVSTCNDLEGLVDDARGVVEAYAECYSGLAMAASCSPRQIGNLGVAIARLRERVGALTP